MLNHMINMKDPREVAQKIVLPAACVILVIAILVWPHGPSNAPEATNSQEATASAPDTSGTDTNAAANTPPSTTGAPKAAAPAAMTYDEAVQTYGSMRFQFLNCRGTPGSMTLKKGTSYLLDNRDDKAHTIAVGTKSYKLGAYGFTVIKATDTGTLNITCDGGGAANLIVQP